MPANETHITRLTRAFGTATSIFRCRGLQYIPPNADNLGGHDLFYWCGFLALLTGWFLLIYMPQCRRLEKLTGREQALQVQLDTEKKELARLERGIASLHKGDSLAWERAARARFGWLEPGEVLDVAKWRQSSPIANAPQLTNGLRMRNDLNAPPMLPRPVVPRLPRAPSVPQASMSQVAYAPFSDLSALGASISKPPVPPALPSIPRLPRMTVNTLPQPRAVVAQQVSYQYRVR